MECLTREQLQMMVPMSVQQIQAQIDCMGWGELPQSEIVELWYKHFDIIPPPPYGPITNAAIYIASNQ